MYNWKDARNYRRFRDENGNVIANIIYVDGEEVAVSDEVYEAYASMDRRERYLEERNNIVLTDNKALFGSRDKNRISVSAVHRLVKKHLLESGLDASQFSAHKLRHTAATLMYQTGKVDVRVLKDILGHEQLNTTQIYTHVSDDSMRRAIDDNPLAHISCHSAAPSGKDDTDESGNEDGK